MNKMPLNTVGASQSRLHFVSRLKTRPEAKLTGNHIREKNTNVDSANKRGTIFAIPKAPSPRGMTLAKYKIAAIIAAAAQLKNILTLRTVVGH
jgi:hypothetical protein